MEPRQFTILFATDLFTSLVSLKMKFAIGITALLASGASAFAPSKAAAHSSSLSSTAEATPTYTFTKSEEIFAEAQEVR